MNPETLDILELEIDELVDYNRTGQNTFFSPGSQQTHNFTVVNTSGNVADFANIVDGQARSAFSSGDDPWEADLPVGAYACTREDSGGSWLSDCESVLLVSNAANGNEWRFEFSNSRIQIDGTQSVTFGLSTSQIWDAYNGSWAFGDSEIGTVDTTVYAFSTSRLFDYDLTLTSADIGDTAVGQWRVIPSSIPTDIATANEMYFDGVNPTTQESPEYLVVAETETVAGIRDILRDIGFDNPAGQMIVFLVSVVLIGITVWWFHLPPIIVSVGYLAVGGMILATGLAAGLFQVLFYITSPLIVIYGIMLTRGDSNEIA
jgi:hypothetical protein